VGNFLLSIKSDLTSEICIVTIRADKWGLTQLVGHLPNCSFFFDRRLFSVPKVIKQYLECSVLKDICYLLSKQIHAIYTHISHDRWNVVVDVSGVL